MPGKKVDEVRVFDAGFRAADDKDMVLEGLAAPFDVWTPIGGSYLERLVADTFEEPVTRGEGQHIPLQLDHGRDVSSTIGKPLEWRIEERGLVGVWQLDPGSEQARMVYARAKEGFLRGLSVGFTTAGPPTDELDVSHEDEVPRVTRHCSRLREVSVVGVGAYESALITKVRTAGVCRVDPRIAAIRRQMGLVK